MPPRRRAPSAESARKRIVELGVLSALVLATVLVIVPFAITWANGVHLQSPRGSSGGQPSATPASSLTGGPGRVYGTITAGPVCPAERSPADPTCAPRPVAGAIIVAKDSIGDELGRATSQADGSYIMPLATRGVVVIAGLPVAGLDGTPAPVSLTVSDPLAYVRVDLEYDTGIR